MPRRVIVLVLLLSYITLSLCGCWDAKDVDKLVFPIAAGYDVHQGDPGNMNQLSIGPLEEPQVDVSVLLPNLSPEATAKVTVEVMPAATVAYARDKRSYTNASLYVTGFNKVILLGEDLARQGTFAPMESLYRFPSVSHTMVLAVVDGRADEVLKTPTPNFENMGVYLNNLLRENKANSFIPTVNLHQFNVWQSPGNNPVLPLIKPGGINGIILSGIAIFNKDHMVGKLNQRQARALTLLRGIKSQGYLPLAPQEEGEEQGTGFFDNDRKVEVERQGDSYSFKIKVILQGIIQELPHQSGQPIDTSEVKKIEESLAQSIQQDCTDLVQLMQDEFKVDCIDISKYAVANWRREIKDQVDRPDFISNANIQVQVEVKITNAGEQK
ncbi:MAG TPA: Ger(x)C family spore germination protein [Syntrophomonadaceae bacterium]|nr:Ger(x)C family spore germination protein [Syntrophomonadaceae bacterium]